ncbi:hypothetical protein D3C78_1000640 [compost metagenome]
MPKSQMLANIGKSHKEVCVFHADSGKVCKVFEITEDDGTVFYASEVWNKGVYCGFRTWNTFDQAKGDAQSWVCPKR